MKNKTNTIIFALSFISASVGVIGKLRGAIIWGNVFLLISTIIWLYILYKIIKWFVTK